VGLRAGLGDLEKREFSIFRNCDEKYRMIHCLNNVLQKLLEEMLISDFGRYLITKFKADFMSEQCPFSK
jgi:hypothetical protein